MDKMSSKQKQPNQEAEKRLDNQTTIDLIKQKVQLEDQYDFVNNLDSSYLEINTDPYEPSIQYFMDQIYYGMQSENKLEDFEDYVNDNV